MNRAALLSLSHGDLIALVQAQQAQIEAQAQQISVLTARIVELEGRLAAPAKTPDNSSIPPSKGQKSNLPDRPKKPRGGHPGVARALTEHPDGTALSLYLRRHCCFGGASEVPPNFVRPLFVNEDDRSCEGVPGARRSVVVPTTDSNTLLFTDTRAMWRNKLAWEKIEKRKVSEVGELTG